MNHPAYSQTDDTHDTTHDTTRTLVSWNPMTLMTQLFKSRLRARLRRQSFRTCVMSVINPLHLQLHDTYDTTFTNDALTRMRTHAHAATRSELSKSCVIVSSVSPALDPGHD